MTPLEQLLQLDVTNKLLPAFGREQWQLLHLSSDNDEGHLGIWCALLDEDHAKTAIENDGWDLLRGNGTPGFSQSWSDRKTEITTYHRYSSGDGLRPFVLYRYFHGTFPKYFELDEEFRLYHDLASDPSRGVLLSFDRSGREIEVVRIADDRVEARLKYLRQFQAATRFHLALYVDSVRYSNLPLEEIPESNRRESFRESGFRWHRVVAKCEFKKPYLTFSRLLGKVVLSPPPVEASGVWPFDKDDRQVSFIVGIDGEGNAVEHTSDPDALANYFGANPGAAHYLTPVFFRREVLGKYFSEPDRYSVGDGAVSCLSLWYCRIDNDIRERVAVFLGDLGRDLPYEERLHWRQFNIPPEGAISETNFRRSFLAQFTDPKAPDLTFRHQYAALNRAWTTKFGWPLFLEPTKGDAHLLETIRVPLTNAQSELDEQIVQLAKLLVDSLNEKELSKRAGSIPSETKSIGKLVGFLKETGFGEADGVIQFLRDLQALRSAGSAHRKGSNYDAIIAKLGVDIARKPDAVRRLLEEASAVLRALQLHYLKESPEDGV